MASGLSYPYATDLDGLARKKPSKGQSRNVTQLPALPTASPPPGPDSQNMVPYTLKGRNSPAGIRASADALDSEEKMRVLETRLGMTEKSNRGLLEEVLRLQSELKVTVARNEQAIRDEKQARAQLDTSVQAAKDLVTQLNSRLKGAEDKLQEERSALSSLVSHTKGVEQAVLASQQELQTKKDSQSNKLLDLQSKVMETQRAKEQLEKMVYNLSDELRAVHNKVEGQQAEFSTVVTDLKLRSRRLEEENKLQLDALRKQGDIQSHTEQNTSHLRGQVETRLSELRDVILDLRSRQDAEVNERRTLEQLLQQKVNELNMGLGEQNRKREEALHAIEMVHREREHAAETEKLKLHGKLTENMEEMNKRLLTKELKLKEEMQDKYQQLEKIFQKEADKRSDMEQKLRDDNDGRWAALKKVGDEEVQGIKAALKNEQGRSKESLQKLDESISLLEKQLQEQKRQSDKVVAAEIKSRKDHERRTQEDIKHIEEKLQVATTTLQQSIVNANAEISQHQDKMRQEMRSMIEASEQGTTRAMTDMDTRLESMKQKVTVLEQSLDSRISESVELNEGTAMLTQNLREQVMSLCDWRETTSSTLQEFRQDIRQMPNDIREIEESQKKLKTDVEDQISSEAKTRKSDIEELKEEIETLKKQKQPDAASKQDVEELQTKVRQLTESVQTVKTVLAMKIQSEQKQREGDVKRLEDDVEELNKKIKPLLDKPNDNNPGVNDRSLNGANR